jgi:cytochrome c-type biogenesis protein CcmH/NrfG
VTSTGQRGTAAPSDDGRWHLEDERDFLERSLADAANEHDAGDMTDDDYDVLTRRDRARLAQVAAALAALDASGSRPEPGAERFSSTGTEPGGAQETVGSRPGRLRGVIGVLGLVALVAGGALLVSRLSSPRLPGQTPTGGVKLNAAQTVDQQLEQATALVQENNVVGALKLYHQVLTEDPTQPAALAESGWLEWEAGRSSGDTGVTADGMAAVRRAVAVDPGFAAGHLFMGTIELEGQHDPGAAVTQYRLFLADHPAKSLVTTAAPFIDQAFTDANLTPPTLPAS